ncbi:MAG TPA: L-threonylcarbamoyladenylate synthase [Bacillota bacterium]|nr:L-threonylcarbamoyladenylate synthase [Bacillota bacterium]
MIVLKPLREAPNDPEIQTAAAILLAGGVVAFPTETVYGLGACFDQPEAVRKIYLAKGRPSDNPLIALIAGLNQLELLVREWPPLAAKIAAAFWPGPLTMVLPKVSTVPDEVTAGLDTVAVRMPAHPLALALITATGTPLVAPSANRSGRPSPTSAEHVAGDLGDNIDAVLDGGISDVGLESTVIGIGEDHIVIFRPGAVTREMIQSVSGSRFAIEYAEQSVAPPSPGMKYAHYSPEAKVYLVMSAGSAGAKLAELADELALKGEKVGVLAHDDTLAGISLGLTRLSLGSREDLRFAAHMLYAQLRLADHAGLTVLLVEAVDDSGVGMALMNRLRKAACKIIEE